MAAVRSSRTDLEQRLAHEMWAAGLRGWRRQRRVQGAKPDFVFSSARVAVFVDGCFWHWCPECEKVPATNRDYWLPKLQRNRDRDRQQTEALGVAGWAVVRFWGHEIDDDAEACAREVLGVVVDRRSQLDRAEDCSTPLASEELRVGSGLQPFP